MSVLIKGMKMPENCIKCPMQFGGWCYAAPPEIDERVAPTVDEAVEKGKPEWCPLVDLGKHGRLTYMPDLVRNIIEPHLPEVSDNDLTVMIEDCDFQDRMRLYGDERIDKPGWIRWKELLIAERNRRGSDDVRRSKDANTSYP